MLDLIGLALRNTLRNLRRTILTLVSILIGCAAIICLGGFINFTFEGLRETTIRTQLGHFQVVREGYFEHRHANLASVLIDEPTALEDALREIDHVTTVTSRLTFSGVGGVGRASLSMSVVGVDPDSGTEFSDFEIVIEGRNLRPGDESVGVVGRELMTGMGAEIGDWVTVLTSTMDGVVNAVEFKIVGVVRTGSSTWDAVYAKVPLGLAKRALDTDGVERVVVLLDDTGNLSAAVAGLKAVLASAEGAYETREWHELAEFYGAVVTLYEGLFRVFAGIVVLVVLFSVVNTMTMSVMERTSEICALRAMGASSRTIMAMIMTEGAILGIAGAVIGFGVALVAAELVEAAGGIEMPPPPGMSEGYQAYLSITTRHAAIAMGLSALAALLSSVPPALSALRTDLVSGLRS